MLTFIKFSKLQRSFVLLFICATLVSCGPNNAATAFSVERGAIKAAIASNEKIVEFDFCSITARSPTLSNSIVENEQELKSLENIPDDQMNSFNAYVTGLKIAIKETPESCDEIFKNGEQLLEQKYAEQSNLNRRNWTISLSADQSISKVQQEIINLAIADAAVRTTWGKLNFNGDQGTHAEQWARIEAVELMSEIDEQSASYMDDILNREGWPTTSKFGEDISFLSWGLIQHADHRPELQKKALEAAELLLENGEFSKTEYAYLVDRVAVNTGERQIYGTQSTGKCIDGSPEMRPMIDLSQLDERRKNMGLNAHHDYLVQLSRSVCGK